MRKAVLGGATYRLVILSPGPSNAPGCKRVNKLFERSLRGNVYIIIDKNVVNAICIKCKFVSSFSAELHTNVVGKLNSDRRCCPVYTQDRGCYC